MAEFESRQGNIFNSEAAVVVVTVNCMGFMGKGMALECALRFPEIEKSYKEAVRNNQIRIGDIFWTNNNTKRQIVLFPTKNDYKRPSKLDYIVAGLESLVVGMNNKDIKSIAIPRLGSELGGLDWSIVQPITRKFLERTNACVEYWNFDSKQVDPLVLEAIEKLKVDPISISNRIGIPESVALELIRLSETRIFSSAVDLLEINKLGKQGVRKILALHNENFEEESTLF